MTAIGRILDINVVAAFFGMRSSFVNVRGKHLLRSSEKATARDCCRSNSVRFSTHPDCRGFGQFQ